MLSVLGSLLKRMIGERHYNKLRLLRRLSRDPGFYTKYTFTNVLDTPQLSAIGRYHGTDKVEESHAFNNLSYLDIYEKYFSGLRDKDISIMEIGVRDGDSLRTWKSYFKCGTIYGIDIDPRCKDLQEERINIEIGSQDDMDFLCRCFGQDTNFDIIIDDGSHINSFTIASFECLFTNRLKPGGIYIIEDLGCSYDKLQTNHNVLKEWPGMKYNDASKTYDNDRRDMEDFFMEKIRKLDHGEGNIQYLHFWSQVCVIMKT